MDVYPGLLVRPLREDVADDEDCARQVNIYLPNCVVAEHGQDQEHHIAPKEEQNVIHKGHFVDSVALENLTALTH